MQKLNFPPYSFRFKNNQNKIAVFDEQRKKFVILTPEEWVRQHCVKFLKNNLNYPASLINVEKKIEIAGLVKRYDIVVFEPQGTIDIIVECKAPGIKIRQETFDQIARYNLELKANFLMLTNGLDHYFCKMDYEKQTYLFLQNLPEYASS
ncbi:restriction endonuclease subunit R [Christiangramia fulva]|uniref:Restriction endonuclease subunit R n=1 Tax=Christiangramia fulva TaxID=2126553 RepID=A0A2R3Z695_9FLAO|nr:type I restriction enzyme HsdR N-terminal domain-containing protein [Christiangramia fulva]AVR45796.1 restriction endonuclease subunit R [Christiangramia fulva]